MQTVPSTHSPLASRTTKLRQLVERTDFTQVRGKVSEVVGTIIRASVNGVKIGDLCHLVDPNTQQRFVAEVIGFSKQEALLTPINDIDGLSANTEVIPSGQSQQMAMSDALLGRVLNGLGEPIDGAGPIDTGQSYPIINRPPNPMTRSLIDRPIQTGVRAIDGLLTCGQGQRLGVFASAGVGKSSLLSMITRATDADIIVIGLIGERGREVREFIERDLGPEGRKKSVVVVATSDRPAMERVNAAHVATAVAEYFRDQDKRVLLLMDSVTRFARALREIGLAAGEPPARRGFPPSVFASLPKLLERAGPAEKGSITALYTVLVEGDDMTEPVADEVRSILDGHIVLSRELAEAGHFPAIDILASTSRVMNAITQQDHQAHATRLRQLLAKYKEIELLVKIGEYQSGSDAEADAAIQAMDAIKRFLVQRNDSPQTFDETLHELSKVVSL